MIVGLLAIIAGTLLFGPHVTLIALGVLLVVFVIWRMILFGLVLSIKARSHLPQAGAREPGQIQKPKTPDRGEAWQVLCLTAVFIATIAMLAKLL